MWWGVSGGYKFTALVHKRVGIRRHEGNCGDPMMQDDFCATGEEMDTIAAEEKYTGRPVVSEVFISHPGCEC